AEPRDAAIPREIDCCRCILRTAWICRTCLRPSRVRPADGCRRHVPIDRALAGAPRGQRSPGTLDRSNCFAGAAFLTAAFPAYLWVDAFGYRHSDYAGRGTAVVRLGRSAHRRCVAARFLLGAQRSAGDLVDGRARIWSLVLSGGHSCLLLSLV